MDAASALEKLSLKERLDDEFMLKMDDGVVV